MKKVTALSLLVIFFVIAGCTEYHTKGPLRPVRAEDLQAPPINSTSNPPSTQKQQQLMNDYRQKAAP